MNAFIYDDKQNKLTVLMSIFSEILQSFKFPITRWHSTRLVFVQVTDKKYEDTQDVLPSERQTMHTDRRHYASILEGQLHEKLAY
jgi:hypothetical protein